MHLNAVSYDPETDRILVSVFQSCEVLVIDHSLPTASTRGHSGGRHHKGGDILYRFGNPKAFKQGGSREQILYVQHGASFLPGGNVIVFNNGRCPDRLWSTIDEYELPPSGSYESPKLVSSYGPALNRPGSFYCTHLGGCRRLPNGNTLVTESPKGLVWEITPAGEEVWRYVNPVMECNGGRAVVRQGDQRVDGRFYLFTALRYPPDYPGLRGKDLTPKGRLEAVYNYNGLK